MSDVYVNLPIDFLTLSNAICSIDRDDVIDLIKYIDISMADWEFTKELIDYFEEQHKIFKEELDIGE